MPAFEQLRSELPGVVACAWQFLIHGRCDLDDSADLVDEDIKGWAGAKVTVNSQAARPS